VREIGRVLRGPYLARDTFDALDLETWNDQSYRKMNVLKMGERQIGVPLTYSFISDPFWVPK
jgi:hypothetical protein